MRSKSILWECRRVGSQKKHYLFGTMHLATEGAYTYVPLAKKYIQKTSIYASEMDLNHFSDTEIRQYYMLPDGQLLTDLFKKRHFERYQKICKKAFGIDLQSFLQYTPFFISNYIAQTCIESKHSMALDHYLWSYAMDESKIMTGVESFDDQVAIMRAIPINYQVKSFRDMMGNVTLFKKKIHQLDRLYIDGDIVQMYKSVKRSMGEIRKLMIYDRNQHMTQRIIDITSENAAFIAIGAAHLEGEKGILALLKKSGYLVKPIYN